MKTANKPQTPTPIRVVVVEDNEDDIALLMRQLKMANMADMVHFLTDGQAAIDFFESLAPDLADVLMVIFLDLKLPTVTGLKVLSHLRSLPKLTQIPVIIMTSSNDPKDMEECRRLKVINYVEKPVTFTTFSKAMADVFHAP
jgi:two-component system, response regulator